MNFSIFSRKLIVTEENIEEEFLDLSGKTIEVPKNIANSDFMQLNYKIPSFFNQRVDLISWEFYGTVNNAEYILKANGISNPYYLQSGMEINIPSLGLIQKMTKNPKVYDKQENQFLKSGSTSNINRQYQLPKNEKGKKRLEFLKRKYKKGTFLPPSLRTLQEADQMSKKVSESRTIRETLRVNTRREL